MCNIAYGFINLQGLNYPIVIILDPRYMILTASSTSTRIPMVASALFFVVKSLIFLVIILNQFDNSVFCKLFLSMA